MARGHLILTERHQVQALHGLGFSQASIARRLGRHPSTISRERRRNADDRPYHGDHAHRRSQRRRQQASDRPRIPVAHWAQIEAQLRLDHSPEQVAGCTGLASHERIYGTEFAEHQVTALALDADHYFAQPNAAWQRGSNENANGLARQYLPKGTDLDAISNVQVQWIEDRLAHRPRKRLGFRTPYEVFFEALNPSVSTQR